MGTFAPLLTQISGESSTTGVRPLLLAAPCSYSLPPPGPLCSIPLALVIIALLLSCLPAVPGPTEPAPAGSPSS